MSADEMVWNLIINYPLLDDITVYFITPNQTKKYTGGDKYPFSLREIALPNFVFPLRFDGSQTATVYIRVQSSGSLNVPFSLVQNHKLIEKSSTQSFYYGIYYGALFILILYNLLVYSSTRINSFFQCLLHAIHYAVYVVNEWVCLPVSMAPIPVMEQYVYPYSGS